MSEDRGDCAPATARCPKRPHTPGPRVKLREKQLIHRVIDCVSLQKNITNFDKGFV